MKQHIWCKVRAGQIALGHRPRRAWLAPMREDGVTHVLSLQSEREGAQALGAAVEAAGLGWLWLPFESAKPPPPGRDAEIVLMYDAVAVILDAEGRVFIHCAAGIHRTGMLIHGLLRRLGYAQAEARAFLERLRPLTAAEVGEHRLAWASASRGSPSVASREGGDELHDSRSIECECGAGARRMREPGVPKTESHALS